MNAKALKHTPGPWKIKRNGTTIESIGPCDPDEYAGSAWLEISEPDARLIAAAPDLLDALKYIAKTWPDVFAARHARASIAKAEGRA